MLEWLVKQKESAKVAWTVVVVVLGLLGYKVSVEKTVVNQPNPPVVTAPAK